MTTVASLQATSSSFDSFERSTVERRAPRPDDVAIDIAHCGICHSDISGVEMGFAPYPIVPGHEITGVVREVGAEVTAFRPGDRVGVGCFVDSCGQCDFCRAGQEQFCPQVVVSFAGVDHEGNQTQGGYSRGIVVRDRFVLRIPDALALDEASPLLCAGITTYNPLKRYGIGPGSRLAVVGLGGLGHIAVQFARAMGAGVTVLGHSEAKREEAARFGATGYEVLRDPGDFEPLADSFDFILNTTAVPLDVDAYLSLLRVDGVLCSVGLTAEPQSFNAMSLFSRQLSITASNVGGIAMTQEMLDFAAEHRIRPVIQTITADQVPRAYRDILDSKVRYRCVIDMSTL
ncbi:NAD(P)-dependent alcohol dehydrogenase [uncultured Propionibacterium sp.]|uniref:NAD(P)-dependent alcohol dehydrogenase n=1 Tax=uncultured Propionibacterium sp. TaxID=218066 RepID=UPI00292CAB67|nr:NAD(P)-dependent alcohol dehydrogenase [uncultured Propionibacterium sp.]